MREGNRRNEKGKIWREHVGDERCQNKRKTKEGRGKGKQEEESEVLYPLLFFTPTEARTQRKKMEKIKGKRCYRLVLRPPYTLP